MPDMLRFPASEMAAEINESYGAVFFSRCRPGAHSPGESCGGLTFADLLALARKVEECRRREEEEALDLYLLDRFEAMQDARFDAVSAHWGHD